MQNKLWSLSETHFLQVDKNSCNLVMMNPTYSQSGTYSCIMTTNKGLSRHTFERNIIVYHVPEYFLRYRVRFLTFSCSIGTLEKLLLELKIIFCPAKPFGCKFQIKITACSSQEQEFWKTLNFNENSKVGISLCIHNNSCNISLHVSLICRREFNFPLSICLFSFNPF